MMTILVAASAQPITTETGHLAEMSGSALQGSGLGVDAIILPDSCGFMNPKP